MKRQFTITSLCTYAPVLNPMEECFSGNKSREKHSLTSTWRTAPQCLFAERMTVVVLEVSWSPFGSWCRVQSPCLWLTSNSDTTWFDCSWHNTAAKRILVSTKDTHSLPTRCWQGSHLLSPL